MKRFFIQLVIVLVSVVMVNEAMAGGAAARRKQMGGQMKQQQAQQIEMQKKMQAQALLQQQQQNNAPIEELDFDALWEILAISSEVWGQLVDHEIKVLVIQTYVEWYQEQGIIIQQSPEQYISLLDMMVMQDAGIFERPFQDVLRFAAVMQYDFGNGMNPDQLAYQMLGPAFYEQNKKRLGR